MADFSKIDWSAVLQTIAQVEAEIRALQSAVTVDAQAKAIGDLAATFVSAAESFSGKDLVNDDAFKALIADVVKGIADAEAIKPKPPTV